MALKSIYNVVQYPVISDKAYKLNKKLKQVVLVVHPDANKPLVKEALKKLFNVEVEDVKVLICKGKARRLRGRQVVAGLKKKKVIVTLKEGYSINFFDQISGVGTVANEHEESTETAVKKA